MWQSRLFIFMCSTIWSCGLCNPQLNLPLPTPQPEIFYNGYTPNVATTPAQMRADRDRSQRYGPPYADEGGAGAGAASGAGTDDGLDDFRVCFFVNRLEYIENY